MWMRRSSFAKLGLCAGLLTACAVAPPEPTDLRAIPMDLQVPAVTAGTPAPGARVRCSLAPYAGTDVHHLLYLPADWRPDATYPVIVEYAGNGPHRSRFGDVSTGEVDGSNLGYGISGGEGFIWVCAPYVAASGDRNERRWWGDRARTVAYLKALVPDVCRRYGGDPDAVFLAGFSRGAIACNYIGLHDDEVAALWCGFICHSHYDGVRRWGYGDDDSGAATARLGRLGDRPQWISHEGNVDATRRYLQAAMPEGRFTIRPLPFPNHTDAWVLRDVPLRRTLRAWVRQVLRSRSR